MRRLSWFKTWPIKVFGLSLAILTMSAPAAAETACTEDADCGPDEYCVRVPCAAVPCASGEECPEPVCEAEGYCVPRFESDPAECAQDADCPEGFVCETGFMPCGDIGCPPCACDCPEGEEPCDCECPECPDPEPCDPVAFHYCVFAPQECGSDAECAEGFECRVQEACSVSGCECAAGCVCPACPDGAECPPCECEEEPEPCDCPEDPEPECEVVGRFCMPKEVPCEADGDCPGDFVCVTWDAPVCACAACRCDPSAPDCDCDPTCDCEEPGEVDGMCAPRSWADAGIPAGAEPQPGEAAAEYARDLSNQDDDAKGEAQAAGTGAGGGCSAGSANGSAVLVFLATLLLLGLMRRRAVSRA